MSDRITCQREIPTYKPSAYYFREALREARTKANAVEVGMQAVREIENLKEQMREVGIEPQPQHIMSNEIEAKDFSATRQERFALVPSAGTHSVLVALTGCEVRHV